MVQRVSSIVAIFDLDHVSRARTHCIGSTVRDRLLPRGTSCLMMTAGVGTEGQSAARHNPRFPQGVQSALLCRANRSTIGQVCGGRGRNRGLEFRRCDVHAHCAHVSRATSGSEPDVGLFPLWLWYCHRCLTSLTTSRRQTKFGSVAARLPIARLRQRRMEGC